MEAFLAEILPRVLPMEVTFKVYVHRGKSDLLKKLESRLRGYKAWMPDSYGIVVLIDRDGADCYHLKSQLEEYCEAAGLITRTSRTGSEHTAVTRLAIEELEAWYFGNWPAVIRAYPKLSPILVSQAAFRRSDEIAGGTWEAFERVLQSKAYFSSGLRKVEAARRIGQEFEPEEASSPSFISFLRALRDLTDA